MLVCFMLLNVIVCSSIWCSYKIWCSGLTSIEHQNNGTAADRRSLPSKTWRRRWNLCSTLGTARHGRMSLCVFGCRWMPDISRLRRQLKVSSVNLQHLLHRNLYGLWGSVGRNRVGTCWKTTQKDAESVWKWNYTCWGSLEQQCLAETLNRATTNQGKEWQRDILGTHNIFSDSRIWLQYS